MSGEPTTDDVKTEEAPELNDLVKVVFLGSSDPRETNGHIKLMDGPNGEPRGLTLGGAKEGDPPDALITPDELHMLTGQFQMEVCEEQPKLTPEEVEAQAPENASGSSGIPVTMPLDDNGNPIETTPEAGDDLSPPAPTPPAPSQPSEPVSPTPGDGVSAPAAPTTPASPPEPTSPTPPIQ